MVQVRVRRPFEFEGRQVIPGDILTISPVMAAVLHRRGHISLTKIPPDKPAPAPVKVAALEAEPPSATPRGRGRGRTSYRRRDVVTKA